MEKKRTSTMTPCLCPPLFLLNHSPYPHCVSYRLEEEEEDEKEESGAEGEEENKETKNRFLVARACRSASKGQQLFLSYGRLLSKSAAHSLCYYGFVVPSAEDPDAALEVELLEALEEQEEEGRRRRRSEKERQREREELRKKLLLPGLETRHFLRATGILSPAALSAAREVSVVLAEGGGGRGPALLLSAGEVLQRAVAAARAALAATAERVEEEEKAKNSSTTASSSPFALAILDYARSGVELADKVSARLLGAGVL